MESTAQEHSRRNRAVIIRVVGGVRRRELRGAAILQAYDAMGGTRGADRRRLARAAATLDRRAYHRVYVGRAATAPTSGPRRTGRRRRSRRCTATRSRSPSDGPPSDPPDPPPHDHDRVVDPGALVRLVAEIARAIGVPLAQRRRLLRELRRVLGVRAGRRSGR